MFFLIFLFCFLGIKCDSLITLEEYIQKNETSFKYIVNGEGKANGTIHYNISITSLKWNDIEWEHTAYCSKKIDTNHSGFIIYLENEYVENNLLYTLTNIAKKTEAIICVVSSIPPQPFLYNGKTLREYEFLAETWKQFLSNNNSIDLLHFPATKSLIKCMDAFEDFFGLNKFTIVGDGFIRGIVTYLSPVFDSRVVRIMPVQVDIDVKRMFLTTWKQLCFWPTTFNPFWERKLLYNEVLISESFKTMLSLFDPIYFIDRINVPLFILEATGEEYFAAQISRIYLTNFSDPENVYYYLLKNTDTVDKYKITPSAYLFLESTLAENHKYSSHYNETTQILNVKFSKLPTHTYEVTITSSVFDFRYSQTGSIWNENYLFNSMTDMDYDPEWSEEDDILGFYVEFIWNLEKLGIGDELRFTTPLFTIPDEYPCDSPPSDWTSEWFFWLVLAGIGVFLLAFAVLCIVFYCTSLFCSGVKEVVVTNFLKEDEPLIEKNNQKEEKDEETIVKLDSKDIDEITISVEKEDEHQENEKEKDGEKKEKEEDKEVEKEIEIVENEENELKKTKEETILNFEENEKEGE